MKIKSYCKKAQNLRQLCYVNAKLKKWLYQRLGRDIKRGFLDSQPHDLENQLPFLESL